MNTRLRRAFTLIAAALTTGALVAAGNSPAAAVDDSNGSPGFCPDGNGTTVVVDFTDLGGDVIVRCAPGAEKRSGFDLLEEAGFEVESTTGSGMTSVCRVEGRPAADEELAIDGKSGYQEACAGMPPAAAYWGYWSGDGGSEWKFSQTGPQAKKATKGGFEGWSFALNSTPSKPSVPAVDPVRPDAGASDSGTQNGVTWSGGQESTQDSASSTADDAGSDSAPWIAGGVITVLAVLIVVTTVRRRVRGGHAS